MIRVYRIRATWEGQLTGFDSQPLPEDFDDMEAAETAIRAFNDKNLEIHEWGPAAQITVPPDSVVCVFEEREGDWRWVSIWVAAAEEHTRMVTQEPVSGFPDRTPADAKTALGRMLREAKAEGGAGGGWDCL